MPNEYKEELSIEYQSGDNNHFIEYRRLIMSELESLSRNLKEVSEKIISIDKRLAVLETKAAMVGAIAGAFAYGIPKLIELFIK